MARDAWTNNSGTWQKVVKMWTNNNGDWREIVKAWTNIDGVWRQWWPASGGVDPGPGPGVYVLSASSISLPASGNGYAEFNTSQYQGRITEIRLRAAWESIIFVATSFGISGRPNGNFYRNIASDTSYLGRTISHRIDSFDATSLTDFNNGNAIGFTIAANGGSIGNTWRNVQLELTIV